MSTSSRLLALLALLQTPRSWSGGELAERLEVSRRTVRRDVDRLRDLGYPVEGTLGAEGGYRLVAGSAVPPLLLDDDEAVAIVVGLRAAAGHAVAGIDEASARALAKLEQVLPKRLRTRFADIRAATSRLDWSGATVEPGVLTALARAASARERVRFAYRAVDGSTSRRSVEPSGLVVLGRRWYLVGWDEDRQDWRIYRVDRIDDPWSTGRPAPERPLPNGMDAAAYVRERQLGLAPTYRLVATLDGSFEDLASRAGDAVTGLEAVDSEHCRLTIEGDTVEWLAIRLILMDCAFEIEHPPELQTYIGALGERLARASGDQPVQSTVETESRADTPRRSTSRG
jgi:predicted DNA-binding transcriptional regulator YafY